MTSRHDHHPRGDAPRRRRIAASAAALEAAWRAADEAPGGIAAAFDALDGAPAQHAAAALAPWLDDGPWLRRRLGEALASLAADDFAHAPIRSFGDLEAGGGLILVDRGAIRLALQIRPSAQSAPPATRAMFVPGAMRVRVLRGGGAMLRLHHAAVSAAEEAGSFTAAAARPCHSDPPRPLVTGETLALDTARSAFTLCGGTGDALLLQLTVEPPSPLPIRVHDLASGRLVHVAASRRDSSFRAMALALLRMMQRTDAAPLFAAETASEDFAARWNAARELVALDPAAAHPCLAALVNDPHPEVAAAATATLALYPTTPRQGREL